MGVLGCGTRWKGLDGVSGELLGECLVCSGWDHGVTIHSSICLYCYIHSIISHGSFQQREAGFLQLVCHDVGLVIKHAACRFRSWRIERVAS